MTKGVAIKFKSYGESVPKILELLNLQKELKKYDKVVLKPYLTEAEGKSTEVEFVEEILKFVLENKNPVTEVFIAEGSDGVETEELFDSLGYRKLAERYDVSLTDLNNSDTENVKSDDFLKFSRIVYPSVLRNSFVISMPKLVEDEELGMVGALSNMVGAFPASNYSGFFSSGKNKIRKWHIKYSIHDILCCKMPDFAVMDASSQGLVLAGLPLEIDKQGAKILDKEWNSVPYINLVDGVFSGED